MLVDSHHDVTLEGLTLDRHAQLALQQQQQQQQQQEPFLLRE
jgi:hypothetical protein